MRDVLWNPEILYSGKVSREKIFADKDRSIALIRENIIREILYLAHSQKVSPAKISRYTAE